MFTDFFAYVVHIFYIPLEFEFFLLPNIQVVVDLERVSEI